jgi:hypothetical protein
MENLRGASELHERLHWLSNEANLTERVVFYHQEIVRCGEPKQFLAARLAGRQSGGVVEGRNQV